MSFNWALLVFATIGYLAVLFSVAYFAEQGKIPDRWVKHPIIYVLAFGVCCSSWAFYGSVGMANAIQHGYLAFFMGLSVLLLFSSVIIRPLFNLAKSYQLSSLADLFAFRYRSRWVGFTTALGVFVAVLPLLALQIQAITDVIVILDPDAQTLFIAASVSLILLYMSILFGTRNIKPSEKHPGLIFALAMEALFKLSVFLFIGYLAYFKILDGSAPVDTLTLLSSESSSFGEELKSSQWFSLLLIFITAPLVLPHLFQILFRENSQPNRLRLITWAAPLYLLLMALPVLPIMWAGQQSGLPLSPEYFTMGVGIMLQSPTVIWLTYLGGLSAACGVTIIAALSMSSMLLNHLVLPFYKPTMNVDIYQWLLWVRRVLIGFVFVLIFAFYVLLNQTQNQSVLLITSYTGLLQMTPGIVGLLFWARANRQGFIAGVFIGLMAWLALELSPLLIESLSLADRIPLKFAFDQNNWTQVIFISISLNAITFIVMSLLTETVAEEKTAAEICVISSVDRRQRIPLRVKNAREFIDSLSKPLGQVMAEREVRFALNELKYDLSEYRPYALRRLRDTLEANLSGMMGPSVAQAMVSRYLPYENVEAVRSEDIHFLEQNLDNYHYQLSGMSAELDRLRRHHRETLYRLPIGVCSMTSDGEILLWNELIAQLTGIPEEKAIGAKIDSFPTHWFQLLNDFINGSEEKITVEQKKTENVGHRRWFSLHKTRYGQASSNLNEGIILLLEDETEYKMLESELVHSERLASIGQLAAGIAHEIGNPITAIDCLAQDLKYSESTEETIEIGNQIRNQADRVTKIVRSLINFSHAGQQSEKPDHQPHALTEIVQEAIDLLALSRSDKQVLFINDVDPSLEVICSAQRLAQVFINLLGNARDASPPNESVIITAEPDRETLIVTITDRGDGIKPDIIDRIFEPFFTTKDVGKGTGLGLFLSYTIVEEHYGQISVTSPVSKNEGIGTQFTIRLPLHSDVTSSNT